MSATLAGKDAEFDVTVKSIEAPGTVTIDEAFAKSLGLESLDKVAEGNKPFAAKAEGAKIETGDRAVIDFTGRMDGKPFEGGTGGDIGVNVGSGTFIPGFEDQLVGMAAGETRTCLLYTSPSPRDS